MDCVVVGRDRAVGPGVNLGAYLEASRPGVSIAIEPDGTPTIDGAAVYVRQPSDLLHDQIKLANETGPRLLVTVNVDQLIEMTESNDFRETVRHADVRVFDGAPLVALARLLGGAAARITGADLLPLAAQVSMAAGHRIAILGGAPSVANQARDRLASEFPGAELQAIAFPIVTDVTVESLGEVVDELTAYAPQVVFVCLGAPKQEAWYQAWRHTLPPALYVGAGAAVDFAAGIKSRAPDRVQKLGLEWAWRLAQEPRRLAYRYLIRGPRFLVIAIRSIFRRLS